jgi:hypothetical protein
MVHRDGWCSMLTWFVVARFNRARRISGVLILSKSSDLGKKRLFRVFAGLA